MHVIEPGHADALVFPRERDRAVDQNLEAQFLKRRSHIGRVMISKNREPAIIHIDRSEHIGERRGGSSDG